MLDQDNFTYIDIFAGCGGISLGLYNAGWEGLFAIEKSPMAFSTLKHNLIGHKNHFLWPAWLPVKEHDIIQVIRNNSKHLKDLKGKVRLVAGGPPCQGFSFAGKRHEQDERNQLVKSYIKFVNLVRPDVLFFENVMGFTIGFERYGSGAEAYSNLVTTQLENMGYDIHWELVDFSQFGVPQRRKRFILVGMKDANAVDFFNNLEKNRKSFLHEKKLPEKITVKKAISDLEKKHGVIKSEEFKHFEEGVYGAARNKYQKAMREEYNDNYPDSHRFPNHRPETVKRFNYLINKCEKNKRVSESIKKKFGLKKKCTIPLEGDDISPTLTTLPDDYIHYNEPRIMTVREYARIQSFNDWFVFKGNYTTGGIARREEVPRYSQVGNAIPPLFMEQGGQVIKEIVA